MDSETSSLLSQSEETKNASKTQRHGEQKTEQRKEERRRRLTRLDLDVLKRRKGRGADQGSWGRSKREREWCGVSYQRTQSKRSESCNLNTPENPFPILPLFWTFCGHPYPSLCISFSSISLIIFLYKISHLPYKVGRIYVCMHGFILMLTLVCFLLFVINTQIIMTFHDIS